MTYVRINESVVGPFENQGDADKLFLERYPSMPIQ